MIKHCNRIIVGIFMIVNNYLLACATCYGAPDDPASKSLNYAIIVLLAFIGSVLLGLIFSIFSIRNKSKAFISD
jgi:hypothetical protein|tara:strand:- start:690 stop:911 length:222 start_codon:yes stop_codon:yes gene_type:complete